MHRHKLPSFRVTALLVGALAVLSLAACGSSDSEGSKDTTTTTAASSSSGGGESAATIAFDKEIQQELIDVGCNPGAADGVIGPETDAAIVAFQTAAGLTPDGELGPETEAALTKAVDDGTKVCTSSTSTTTTPAKTTTTAASGGGASCTASAILAALPSGSSLTSYVCSDGYAAGSLSSGEKFILQDESGVWTDMGQEPCGSASAGLPPVILEDGCS